MSGDNIQVAVRLRPLIERERKEKAQIWWAVEENSIRSIDPTDSRCNDPYTFDHIFGMDVNNLQLYEKIIAPLVLSCVEGYHCTIFTYGQTSSGKTHTMDGTRLDRGVIPRVVDQLFQIINERKNCKFLIRVAYIEIYNERIYDLLNKQNTETKIREDLRGNITVCAEELVTSTKDQVLELMQFGKKNRKIHSTRMNIKSSRSHTIFRIIVECTEEGTGGVNLPVKMSHFNLVDLAGSERVAQTKATGQRLVEGAAINKSLSTLTLVISQLADKSKFLNYRDSKLTLILRNALGGNAKTLIIANITAASLEDTHSTLSFAKRAKTIKNQPVVNTTATSILSHCQQQIQKLQKELRLVTEQNKDLVSHSAEAKKMVEILRERIKLNLQAFAKPETASTVSKRRHTVGPMRNINKADEFRNILTKDWTVPSAGIPLTAIEKRLLQVVRTNFQECSETEIPSPSMLPFEAQFLNLSQETNDAILEDEVEEVEEELSIAKYTLDDIDSETESDEELQKFEELERCIAATQTTEDLQNDLKKLRVITKSFTSKYAQQVSLNKTLENRNRILSDEITNMMKQLTLEENPPIDENLCLEVANLQQKLVDQNEILTQLKMKHKRREEELSISLAEHRKEKQKSAAEFTIPEGGETSKAAERYVPDVAKLDEESLSHLEENIMRLLTEADTVDESDKVQQKERHVLLRLLNSTEGTIDACLERHRSLKRLSTEDLSEKTNFKAALEEFTTLMLDEIETIRSEVGKINAYSAGLNKLLRKINDYNLHRCHQDVSEVQEQVLDLEKQLDQEKKAARSAQNNYEQAKREISENKVYFEKWKELSNVIVDLNNNISALNQHVLELETQLELQKNLASSVHKNYDQAKHEISEAKLKIDNLNSNISALNQQVFELENLLDLQKNIACVVQKNYDQAKCEISESKVESNKLRQERNELNTLNVDLKKEISALNERGLELERQLELEKNVALSIWVDYEQLKYESSDNIVELEKLQMEMQKSNTLINDLKGKILKYEEKISELTENVKSVTSKLEHTEDSLLEVLKYLSIKEKELQLLQREFQASKVLKNFNESYYENKLKHIESVLSSFNDLTTKTIHNKLYRTKSLSSLGTDAEAKRSNLVSFSSLHNISLCEHAPTLRDIINDLIDLNRLLQKTTSTQNLQANESELSNLKQVIQGKVNELTEMEETLNEIRNRNDALEELFKDYNKQIHDYKKEIESFHIEIEHKEKVIDMQRLRIEELECQIKNSAAKASNVEELNIKIAQLESLINSYVSKLNSNENDLASKNSQYKTLQDEFLIHKEELTKLKEERTIWLHTKEDLAKMQEKNEFQSKDIGQLKQQLTSLRQERVRVTALQEEVEVLKKMYEGLSTAYANTKKACECHTQENLSMRKTIRELQQLKSEVENELREQKLTNSSLSEQCKSLQDKFDQLRVKAAEEIDQCNTKCISTVEQNKFLMDKLKQLEKEKGERLQTLKKRDVEIAGIQKELHDLELKLHNSSKELRKIRSRCVCEGASGSPSSVGSWKTKRRGIQDHQRDLSCSSCNELNEKIKNLEMKIFNMEAQQLRPPEQSTSERYYQCRVEVQEKQIQDLREERAKLLAEKEKLGLERNILLKQKEGAPSTSEATSTETQKQLKKLQEQLEELSTKYNQAKAIARRRGNVIAELESQLKKKE